MRWHREGGRNLGLVRIALGFYSQEICSGGFTCAEVDGCMHVNGNYLLLQTFESVVSTFVSLYKLVKPDKVR